MSQTKENIKYINGLDGLRAFAVLLVIFFHYTITFPDHSSSTHLSPIWKFFSIGWVGVDIFFVISGYLIAAMLIRNPINTTGDYWKYLLRRAKRLLPAYVTCSTIFIALLYTIDSNSKIISNQYLLWTLTSNIPSIFGDRAPLGDGHINLLHFWSLALEWQFYITFPIALALTKSARTTAIIAILIAIISRLYLMWSHPLNFDNAIYSFTACRGDALAFGVLTATIKPIKNQDFIKAIGLAGFLLLSTLLILVSQSGPSFKAVPWLQSFGYSVIACASAMVVFSIANLSKTAMPIRILESRPIALIGRSSYSLYIWHLPLLPLIYGFSKKTTNSSTEHMVVTFAIAILFTIIAASISYILLEKQFMYRRPTPTIRYSPDSPVR
ncbi:acyltransferase family protein [Pseudomonas fluorescens]|uniref:O-acetyltransferase OatA n=1 Tax=Pseudomonas fluorescens TaxID=294 RepID=A0A5E7VAG1_PSEFL|nr:acyltransferase [Pseudomonas fluorescens]VVQ19845.1 O-acetyltransferase OatA [Pseudomonas fluorescens]